ncbi:MAG: DUF3861 domain-containing protein [Campylobacter sp.]|nr:DUF3861 domain-containing protein [Campylobacter sp.]
MNKYQYEVFIKALNLDKFEDEFQKEAKFISTNHDNIFRIIELFKNSDLKISDDDKASFAVGLKLFIEIIFKNKNEALFKELFPIAKSTMQIIHKNLDK